MSQYSGVPSVWIVHGCGDDNEGDDAGGPVPDSVGADPGDGDPDGDEIPVLDGSSSTLDARAVGREVLVGPCRVDGVEAVELAQAFEPQIALLDIGMPRMDGYEAARRIRAAMGGRVILVALTIGCGGVLTVAGWPAVLAGAPLLALAALVSLRATWRW